MYQEEKCKKIVGCFSLIYTLCVNPAAVPQGDDDRGSSVYSQITHSVELRGHGGSPCVFHRGLSTVGCIKLVARTVCKYDFPYCGPSRPPGDHGVNNSEFTSY